MELLYMWIGHYANIYHKGFNFSNKYHFNASDTTIEISNKSTDSIKLFNDNFINIVAIAGENGSGKTSLLSFVENFFFKDDFQMHKDVKLVYKDNNDTLKVYGVERDNISCPADITFLPINNLTELQENVLPLFFSSGIEIRNEPQLRSRFVEITGEKLLRDKQKEVNKILIEQIESIFRTYNWPNITVEDKEKFERDKRWLLNWSNVAPAYRNDELKRIIHFMCKHNPEEYDFIPSWLEFGFNFNFYDKYREVFDEESALIKKIKKAVYNPIPISSPSPEKYQNQLKESILCELFLFIYYCGKKMVRFHEFEIDTIFIELEGLDSIAEITERISNFVESADFEYSGSKVDFDKLKHLNSNLDDFIKNLNIYRYDDGAYLLERNDSSLNFINAFFDFWYLEEFAFSFKLNEMSAGEKALLVLLSRLFILPEYNNINHTDTVWIFIDEGELYLHPKWQRRFFADLNKYLPKFFSDNKVQLFLSTHSPFVLSDLPKENIILLEKGETGCQLVDLDKVPQTFGANIHELLANSFFMNEGIIGKFAEGIINDLFNFLNDKETEREWSEVSAESLIKNIGEPIIREQLHMLFDIKFGSKTEAEHIEYQISKLQQRLKKIQGNDTDSP